MAVRSVSGSRNRRPSGVSAAGASAAPSASPSQAFSVRSAQLPSQVRAPSSRPSQMLTSSMLPSASQLPSASRMPSGSEMPSRSGLPMGASTTMSGAPATGMIPIAFMRPPPKAYSVRVCGLPLSTVTASCVAGLLYLAAIVAILATDCPFSRKVTYYFVFLLLCLLSIALMAGINMVYVKYHFNSLSLTTSLLYSGSAALIAFGLVFASFDGLCVPQGGGGVSFMRSVTPTLLHSREPHEYSDNLRFRYRQASNTSLTPPANSSTVVTTVTPFLTTAAMDEDSSDFGEGVGIWSAGYYQNFIIFVFSAVALLFQLVGHYFYG